MTLCLFLCFYLIEVILNCCLFVCFIYLFIFFLYMIIIFHIEEGPGFTLQITKRLPLMSPEV